MTRDIHTVRFPFRRWGVLQRIREEWTFPPEWNRGTRLVTSLVGHELVAPRRGGPRHSLAAPIRRPQSALQRVFLDALAGRGVPVAGGWRVAALPDGGAGAVLDSVLGAADRTTLIPAGAFS